MIREAQNNSHDFPPDFVLGHSTDAHEGNCDKDAYNLPVLSLRNMRRWYAHRHIQNSDSVVWGTLPSTLYKVSPRLNGRLAAYCYATASRPLFVLGEHETSFVMLRRGFASWRHHRRLLSFAPEKHRDQQVTGVTGLSLEGFPQSRRCFGRSKRRRALQLSRNATSATPNDFSAGNTSRPCRSFSLSSMKCSESKPNSICGEAV